MNVLHGELRLPPPASGCMAAGTALSPAVPAA